MARQFPTLLLLLSLLLPSFKCFGSNQKTLLFCAPYSLIEREAIICRNNTLFVNHGKKCLAKFESLVAKNSKNLHFKKDSQDQQTEKFLDAAKDYASSISELNSLIEINELAIREVDGYLKHLITPIDDRYLEEVKCFTDNRREIQKILSEFQDKKRELEKIRKISVEYQNASMNRKDKFSSDKNGKVSSSNPNSEVASKTVGEKHRGSDITGLRKKNQQPPSPAPVQEDSQK